MPDQHQATGKNVIAVCTDQLLHTANSTRGVPLDYEISIANVSAKGKTRVHSNTIYISCILKFYNPLEKHLIENH
jgi:hypothetical protein